jgi:carboxyl-terminal processing protease
MAILVDKGSASASEILAGALRHHGKAKLIGATTFGKGSVQELVNITPETALKITVARWLGPDGEQIPTTGIKPDIEVIPSEADIKAGRDVQMERAAKELLK